MSRRSCGAAACLLVSVLACDPGASRQAMGEASSLIVVAMDSIWAEVGDSVTAALERPIFAVRDETTFEVTHISPLSEDWLELRTLRQIVPIGQPGDGWIAPILNGTPADLPAIVERQDIWARGQGVTAIVVEPGAGADAVLRALPALSDTLHARFQQYARNRMFLSGVDSAGADTLRSAAGFSLLLPNLYTHSSADSVWMFRAHAELGRELMRTLLVTWVSGPRELNAESVLALRESFAVYDPAQTTGHDPIRVDTVSFDGGQALQVRGVWSGTDPAFPTAGPFITRAAYCPQQDRTYLIDAWLYAPGRAKYEYLLQFEHILNSFRCEGPAQVGGA